MGHGTERALGRLTRQLATSNPVAVGSARHHGLAMARTAQPPTTRILVLFAHPALQRSRVNRVLAAAAQQVADVTFHDLYEAYPDFDIDVQREQALLEAHDLIVLQHPFYWYSVPALLKQWLDLVLEHGWAYGREGTALHGKKLLCAITTGGRESAYRKDGYNRFTMRELLAPVEQSAFLCGMEFLPPFVVHGTHGLGEDDIAGHASEYQRCIAALRDGKLELDAARSFPRLNADLDAVVVAD
jgi:glutathione-regulated potassium-efflux system ancillary protein KefG